MGPHPERQLLPEITFYLKDLLAWQGKHLITKHLPFFSSYELPSSRLKPQAPILFLSSGGIGSLSCLIAFGSHIFTGLLYHGNLVNVYLMIE